MSEFRHVVLPPYLELQRVVTNHKNTGEASTGLFSVSLRRAYGSELGRFAQLSGPIEQTYQAPHRRFYGKIKKHFKIPFHQLRRCPWAVPFLIYNSIATTSLQEQVRNRFVIAALPESERKRSRDPRLFSFFFISRWCSWSVPVFFDRQLNHNYTLPRATLQFFLFLLRY